MKECLGALIGPWSLALSFGHVHSSHDTWNKITVEECTLYWGGLSPGREHLWAPRLITYGRGAVMCTTGWSRKTQHSSLSESVVWTRLGYFLGFGCWYVPHCIWEMSQVHASLCAVLIGSMDGWWVIVEYGWWVIVGCGQWTIVGCECWIMNVV